MRELERTYLEFWSDVPAGCGFTQPGRQILHCTFGSVLTDPEYGPAVRDVLTDRHGPVVTYGVATEADASALAEKKFGKPKGGWNNHNVLVSTARVGGFLGRKHDGMPGWQTIWRGWHRLMWMCEGLELLKQEAKRCG